jgi:transposase
MSDRKRKSYTPEYRRDAAHLVIDTGRSITAVAKEIGIGEQLLGRWVGIERSRMVDPPHRCRRLAAAGPEAAILARQRHQPAILRLREKGGWRLDRKGQRMTTDDSPGSPDRADVMWVGPIGPIPIFHDDDPRIQDQLASTRSAEARAAALPTLDSLFACLGDPDGDFRKACTNEISRRGREDHRYVPELLYLLQHDPASGVRIAAAFALCDVSPGAAAIAALHQSASEDSNKQVRWSARLALFQLDEGPNPMDE